MKESSDIGKKLREAREKRDLSLNDVAHETRIPLATLQLLEENDYSSFASPAYTKSFLNQYSEYLKIDAHEILENFNTGNVLAQADGIDYLNQEKSSSSHRPPSIRRGPTPPSQKNSNSTSQPLLILLITGGLIAAGIWGLIAVEKRFNAEPETAKTAPPTPIKKTSPSTTTTPKAKIISTPHSENNDRPARVISIENSDHIASTSTSTPTLEENLEEDLEGPVYIFPEDTAPPRAIIVNEDEDEE